MHQLWRHAVIVVSMVFVLSLMLTVDILAQGRVRGQVTDEWGNPIEGATVLAELEESGRTLATLTSTSDGNGRWSLMIRLSGTYAFTITADGYQGAQVRVSVVPRRATRPVDVELAALASGGRLRTDTEYQAEGGTPKLTFHEDGTFVFQDTQGKGEGTYGIQERTAELVVRKYDGPDDKYTITMPVTVQFANDQFTSLAWGDVTLPKSP